MNKIFISLQSVVIFLKGSTPLLIFMLLSDFLEINEFARVVIVISLANLIANLSNLSANTLATVYFYKDKNDIDESAAFQFLRVLVGFVLFFIGLIYLFFTASIPMFWAASILIYQLCLSLMPTWFFYAKNDVKKVLILEFIVRIPVILGIIFTYLNNDINYLIFSFLIGSIISIFQTISVFFKECSFAKIQEIFYKKRALNYVLTIFPYNLIFCSLNSGLVFILGHILPASLIVQLSFLERIKAIMVQAQGIFYLEKIKLNKTKQEKNLFKFSKNNKDYMVVAILNYLLVMLVFLIFPKQLEFIFNDFSTDNYFFYFLYLICCPLNALSSMLLYQFAILKHGVNILFGIARLVVMVFLSLYILNSSLSNLMILVYTPIYVELAILFFIGYKQYKTKV